MMCVVVRIQCMNVSMKHVCVHGHVCVHDVQKTINIHTARQYMRCAMSQHDACHYEQIIINVHMA